MSLRAKVLLELSVLAVLTLIFLVLFPRRNPLLDIALAGFAILFIALAAPYTRNVIWAASPPPEERNRSRRCLVATFWVTVPPALLFFLIGGLIAYQSSGWSGVGDRIFNGRILAAFAFYLPWAWMQQALLQYYLLGRLLALFPNRLAPPLAITGVCFGLVHLPDVWTAAATVPVGIVWSFIYYKYRLLLPLAFSHALLGVAFYYGLIGHNLSPEWGRFLP
jgi:hypothetical protein